MLAILEELATSPKVHKMNLVGRSYQPGALEHRLKCAFSPVERALAYRALEGLQSDGLIAPTLDDLVDPESWIQITERGRVALKRRALDALDEKLQAIDPHLVTIRDGAWSAVTSSEPDALRQAAHSGRELIDQVLKLAAPDPQVTQQSWYSPDSSSRSGVTRRQRLRYIMQTFRNDDSETNLQVAEKACDLVLAIDKKLQSLAHGRVQPLRSDVHDAMSGAEIALRRVLVGES
jgi:DNA-binding PadR family transcriptional regulator